MEKSNSHFSKRSFRASPDVALIKYWGKKDPILRLPENNSISMILKGLDANTTVEFREDLTKDDIAIHGMQSEIEDRRVVEHLDLIRKITSIFAYAQVKSKNNFPKSTGLSSSGSGFAALTYAALSSLGLEFSEKEFSIIARQASGTACRCVCGGFVEWESGFSSESSYSHSIYPPDYWDLRDIGEYFKINLSQRELFDLAYQSVIDVQGKGSGFDVAVAVHGGTIYFLTGGKTIEPLRVQNIPLIIGYSGKKVSTVNLVNEVQSSFQSYPSIIGGVFDIIQLIVEDAKQKLLNEHWDGIGQLSNINQGLLDALGVNTIPLAKIIFAARQAEALGAKLSGAGGGDCMFAIATTEFDRVKAAMSEAGAQIVEFGINADGARIEKGVPNYANT